MNYYNDNDPKVCRWLEELISGGHLPPGDVDERSILEVKSKDVDGYGQCHFFAGIGGWALAARWAGLEDVTGIWSASCPCQPLSGAGRRQGHADERHLWPAFWNLISECRPSVCFGEQVASKDGREWLSGIRLDLEQLGYRVGAADLCAASVGAPHRRQRLYWVADLFGAGLEGHAGDERNGGEPGRVGAEAAGSVAKGGAPGVDWSGFDIVPCRDGKARRVESGTFPLAYGVSGRVGRLRGYGNAIVPQLAEAFIRSWLEIKG